MSIRDDTESERPAESGCDDEHPGPESDRPAGTAGDSTACGDLGPGTLGGTRAGASPRTAVATVTASVNTLSDEEKSAYWEYFADLMPRVSEPAVCRQLAEGLAVYAKLSKDYSFTDIPRDFTFDGYNGDRVSLAAGLRGLVSCAKLYQAGRGAASSSTD